VGNYSVKAFSETTTGILETNDSVSLLPVPSNRSFIAACYYKAFTTNTLGPKATPRPTATAAFQNTSIPISNTAADGRSNHLIPIVVAVSAGVLIIAIITGSLIYRAKKQKQWEHSPDEKAQEVVDMGLLELETHGKRRN
jgi:hypothetical protein